MSNSTTLLDTLTGTLQGKETMVNELIDPASPAMLFGRHASATTGLTWGYYGGRLLVDGVLTAIANGTVALTASTTNYVEATRAGVVSKNTSGFTAGQIPLYTIVTGTATVTSYTDERSWVDPVYMTHQVSVAITTADVTLTAAQARCRIIVLTGTLTGNRNLIVPNNGEWIVVNNTSGAYTVTVKTTAGTGVAVTQSTAGNVIADGTNVIAASSSGAGSNTFGTISVSGQSDVVADSTTDTLTLAAGSGITITTNATTDTITITNSGTASNSFETIAVSGQSNVVADAGTDTLTLVAGSGMTITTNAGTDTITFASSGGAGITLATVQATTSGTEKDFTSIPSGTKRITIMFKGVSVNGTSNYLIQVGDSGGIETTGYSSASGVIGATSSAVNSTSGFVISNGSASNVLDGCMVLNLMEASSNTWAELSSGGYTNGNFAWAGGGTKALSAELDRVRITTANGTDAFDAGSVNISYE